MRQSDEQFHEKADNCFGRIIEYDSDKGVGVLEFENNRINILYDDGRQQVIDKLTLPNKYLVAISVTARVGREMARELGGVDEVYSFRKGERLYYNSKLMRALLAKRLTGVRSIDVTVETPK